ncbi:MAG: WYL domain-containing protein [Pseudomonadota bacterium]
MGRRSATETLAAVIQAFFESPTWTQAELARRVQVRVDTARRLLLDLELAGWPLERQEDHPHVYWSLPRGWFPEGVLLRSGDAAELLRHLVRMPRSRVRDRILAELLKIAPRGVALAAGHDAWITAEATANEEAFLPLAEDSASQRLALHMRYFSVGRGECEWRHVSVQRIVVGPPARLCAACHRSGALKWFRVDNIVAAEIDEAVPFRPASAGDIERFLGSSVDGFRSREQIARCTFFVRNPESRWVSRNLLPPMTVESVPGGIHVSVETAALPRVARFVVGLGAAARPETAELASLVRELAEGALLAVERFEAAQ